MKQTRVIALARRPFRFWLVVAAFLAGSGIAGGVVYASIPDASGVIHGCYKTTNGNLRVIDSPGSTCHVNEQSLAWNQTGPLGQQGPPGAQGLPGQQGPPGPSGVSLYQVVTVTDVADPGQTVETAVPCPIGKSVLGGGVSGPFGDFVVHASYPGFGGWAAQVTNQDSAQQFFTVHAICAKVS